jgi:hypothetical protein
MTVVPYPADESSETRWEDVNLYSSPSGTLDAPTQSQSQSQSSDSATAAYGGGAGGVGGGGDDMARTTGSSTGLLKPSSSTAPGFSELFTGRATTVSPHWILGVIVIMGMGFM